MIRLPVPNHGLQGHLASCVRLAISKVVVGGADVDGLIFGGLADSEPIGIGAIEAHWHIDRWVHLHEWFVQRLHRHTGIDCFLLLIRDIVGAFVAKPVVASGHLLLICVIRVICVIYVEIFGIGADVRVLELFVVLQSKLILFDPHSFFVFSGLFFAYLLVG